VGGAAFDAIIAIAGSLNDGVADPVDGIYIVARAAFEAVAAFATVKGVVARFAE
jgi:hypothetical protein